MEHGKSILARITLSGVCNCCGRCCSYIYNSERVYCENLIRKSELGQENATACRIWTRKYNNMPIKMLSDEGEYITDSVCCTDSENETKAILARGIGKGCSLQISFEIP